MINCSIFMALLVALVGFVLGVAYFYGAYQTAMTLHKQKAPMAVLMGSFVGRTVFVVFIFYVLANGCLNRVLLLLVGFLCGRVLFMKKIMKKLEGKRHEGYLVTVWRRLKEFRNK